MRLGKMVTVYPVRLHYERTRFSNLITFVFGLSLQFSDSTGGQ